MWTCEKGVGAGGPGTPHLQGGTGPEPCRGLCTSWRDSPGSRTTGATARGWPGDPHRVGEPWEVGKGAGALWVAGAEVGTPEGFIHLHLVKGTPWAWQGADRGGPGNHRQEAAGLVWQRVAEQGWSVCLDGEGQRNGGPRLCLLELQDERGFSF